MKQISAAYAALALFDSSMQEEIFRLVRNTPDGVLRASLDRGQNPHLPPGIFSMAGPRFTTGPEDSQKLIMGLSLMLAHSLKKINVGREYWADLFEEVFAIDEAYAAKLADDIDTVDDATGWGNLQYLFSVLPWVERNTISDDIDAPFEVLQAGEVANKLITRAALSTNRMAALMRPDMPGAINEIVERMQAAKEQGDVYAIGDLQSLGRKYSPLPIPHNEMGGFFQDIAKFGQKVLDTGKEILRSDLATNLLSGASMLIPGAGAAISGGLQLASQAVKAEDQVRAGKSQAAASKGPAPAAASTNSTATSPSGRVVVDPLADMNQRTGGMIRVELGDMLN
jgi:hypothetical protein